MPSPLKVFSAEDVATVGRQGEFLGAFTYATCFRLIFLIFGVGGLVLGVVLFLH